MRRHRLLTGLTILAGITAACLVGLAAHTSPASAAPSVGCPQYVFIGARGSGETYQPGTPGDEGVGPVIDSVWQNLQQDLQDSGVTIELMPVPDPPYPAVSVLGGLSTLNGVGAFFNLPGDYHNSVDKIAPWVTQTVAAQSAVCPNQKFILAGYSQGAQGMADALQRDLNPSQILGGAFFGDPYFNPSSDGDWGNYDPYRSGLLGTRPAYSSAVSNKVFSFCHNQDPICQGLVRCVLVCLPTHIDTGQHNNYPTLKDPDRPDTKLAADQLARLIRDDQSSQGNPISEPSPGPITGPLDVGFAIDSTGSMGDIIGQVQSNVTDIAQSLQAADPDLQVGLVDYKDAPPNSDDPYQAQVDVPLTTDLGQFDTAVSNLTANGGGDTPESVYTGMMTTLGLNWRTGAHKEMVVIGDAGGHPVDPQTGYTEQDVIQRALSLDPVAINVIPANSDADATFGPVAAATGGADTPLGGDAATAIESTIQTTQTAPVAELGGPYTGYSDSPITLSAGDSYSPMGRALTFAWDFNNDGTVDQTTSSPTVTHTFGDYAGPVTVAVTDSQGQSAVAQAQVTASGLTPPAPTAPSTPTLTAGDQMVTATWTPGSGGGPVDSYELQAADSSPLAYVTPTGTGTQSLQVSGFVDGTPVSMRVVAINAGGQAQSDLSAPVTPEPDSSQPPTSTTSTPPPTTISPATSPGPPPTSHAVKAGELTIVNFSARRARGRVVSLAAPAHAARALTDRWVKTGRRGTALRVPAGRYRATVRERAGKRWVSHTAVVTVSVGRLTVAAIAATGRLDVIRLPAVSRWRGLLVSLINARAHVNRRHVKLPARRVLAVSGRVLVSAPARRPIHVTVRKRHLVLLDARAAHGWRKVNVPLPG
ncbi:MAG: cutinase family protein [Trebonia sp.]